MRRRLGFTAARSVRHRSRSPVPRSDQRLHRRGRGCQDARDQRHDPLGRVPPHDCAFQRRGQARLLERQGQRRPRCQARPRLRGLGRHREHEEGRQQARALRRRLLGSQLHPRGEVKTPRQTAGSLGLRSSCAPRRLVLFLS